VGGNRIGGGRGGAALPPAGGISAAAARIGAPGRIKAFGRTHCPLPAGPPTQCFLLPRPGRLNPSSRTFGGSTPHMTGLPVGESPRPAVASMTGRKQTTDASGNPRPRPGAMFARGAFLAAQTRGAPRPRGAGHPGIQVWGVFGKTFGGMMVGWGPLNAIRAQKPGQRAKDFENLAPAKRLVRTRPAFRT